ncbi:hypothetical protein JB92DRAFT_2826248 [Gautieria morchelliformis]|nr:hypothetical protein JB92DRAFT_2826248 [Gautieria morchelliformis]
MRSWISIYAEAGIALDSWSVTSRCEYPRAIILAGWERYWVSLAAALSGGNTPGVSFSALRIFVNTLRDSPASVGGLTGLTRSRSGLPRGGAWNDSVRWSFSDVDGEEDEDGNLLGESAGSLDDEILSSDTRPSRSTAGVPARGALGGSVGTPLVQRYHSEACTFPSRMMLHTALRIDSKGPIGKNFRHLTPLFCDAPHPILSFTHGCGASRGRSLHPSTHSYTSSLRTKISTFLWAGTRLGKWKDTLEHTLSTHICPLHGCCTSHAPPFLFFLSAPPLNGSVPQPGSQGLQTPGVQQRRAATPTLLDSGTSCCSLVDPADFRKGNTYNIGREGAS